MRPFRAALPLLILGSPALALDLPARKPGLWELKLVMEGLKIPPRTFQHCIDAATDRQMNMTGVGASAQKCSKQDMQRAGNTITVDSVCETGTGTVTSHAVVNGSFDSAYTLTVSSKRDGGPAIPKMPAETKMSVEAKWLGPCKPDQKPGDMIMGNGAKVNIRDIAGGLPKQ